MSAQPSDLDRQRVRRILDRVRRIAPIGYRIDSISQQLLDSPYLAVPLIGTAQSPEVFTASFEGFDCVTFVESVLALARSSGVNGFVDNVRRIRYKNGTVGWRSRNHYMTAWVRNNLCGGFLVDPMPRALLSTRRRVLDVVPGMPPKAVRLSCLPKRRLPAFRDRIETGDLALFVSTRANLDVFHCGILVTASGKVSMRHAARGRGRVVEQDLDSFLRGHRMSGIIITRPVDTRGL